jgi:KDO2-lipid IV(A) lauroyltransferase
MRRRIRRLEKIAYALQAAPLLLTFSLMRLVPLSWASGSLGRVFRWAGPRLLYSRRIRRNLEIALPEIDTASRRKITRGSWENLGRLAGEMIHLDRIWEDRIYDEVSAIGIEGFLAAADAGETITLKGDKIEIVGAENFARLQTLPGPALIFSPHMGNWELLPLFAARFGVFTSVVFRRPNNPYIARKIERMRAGMVSLIPKGFEGAIAAGRVMQAGGRLGFLVDQKQNRGLEIPFFGKPAMTGHTLAKLALDFDAPIFGTCVVRLPRGQFRFTITPALPYERTGDANADQVAIMTAVNKQVEDWVRAHPEQWLWQHRRWPKHLYS